MGVLATLLCTPVTMTLALHAEDHRVFHDKERNEDHEWNDREDKAYRIWVKENHHKYSEFAKLKAEQQAEYWRWRHDHSDALLKIDIR